MLAGGELSYPSAKQRKRDLKSIIGFLAVNLFFIAMALIFAAVGYVLLSGVKWIIAAVSMPFEAQYAIGLIGSIMALAVALGVGFWFVHWINRARR